MFNRRGAHWEIALVTTAILAFGNQAYGDSASVSQGPSSGAYASTINDLGGTGINDLGGTGINDLGGTGLNDLGGTGLNDLGGTGNNNRTSRIDDFTKFWNQWILRLSWISSR